MREREGEETAAERYDRLRAEGKPTGWSGFCVVSDYCTRPCDECRREGNLADEYLRQRGEEPERHRSSSEGG